MEKHNLYYVPVCSINNLSEQMTTVLIRKMERRKGWGEIDSALLPKIPMVCSAFSQQQGEVPWEVNSSGSWLKVGLETGNNINAQKY